MANQSVIHSIIRVELLVGLSNYCPLSVKMTFGDPNLQMTFCHGNAQTWGSENVTNSFASTHLEK